MEINLHQLELFYYVAHFGGVTEATRRMPRKVDPSTVSKQVAALEKDLGFTLFQRKPFEVTAAGAQVFALIKPVFEGLPGLADRLRRGDAYLVRVGAAPVVLREYMPAIVESVEQQFPELQTTFTEGLQWQIHDWLRQDLIDLAVTMVEGDGPHGCLSEALLRLPMVLLVRASSDIRSAADIWRFKPIKHRLLCPHPRDALTRFFNQGLARRGLEWKRRSEANSIELAESLVKRGRGVAVSLDIPGRGFPDGIRALPLSDFPRVPVGIIWRSNPSPPAEALMAGLRAAAKRMLKTAARSRPAQ